jgi:enamine deaminase RidA (YjgF/YER057c/UK114 family)
VTEQGRPSIRREGLTRRWADRVVYGNTLYLVEVPPDPAAAPETQIAALLGSIETQLDGAGSDKTRLLMVTIYLKDFAFLDCFNQIWEDWLPPGSAPARACVRADLADPGYVVEMAVVAALA